MGDFVTFEQQGKVAILTLNRPDKLNAIGEPQECFDLIDALGRIADNREISVAILTGSGRAFSAGGNLQGMKDRNGIGPLEHPASTRTNYRSAIQKVPRAFRDVEVPIIAAVNGHAIGVGNDIACLCDIRIASTKARFAASFIKMGLVPGDGGAWLLQRTVGFSKAAEMIYTGDVLSAEQALACGLVSRVVEPEQLMEQALELAGRIAANPARSLRMAKRLMLTGQDSTLDAALEMAAAMQAIAHETADHAEAVDAFLEKRDPNFTGR
ncbi:crotonase/enoyl-CoA hydratase family protein [Sphingobium sp. JS3065]|uniref:crotonase/enoyl-CoA hydratase family protein n=1 Tax=Sphingobium sp. JS3065 TaxID=2970925 RepID=UPI0022655209|nr:crotonase/enoyl-CoA hydratase family protein [Sphingobium sp. JS3065]UZW57410.1 crotonase/enoyl-CoA hydratase family protein [Sphingobium sp. JS3065]